MAQTKLYHYEPEHINAPIEGISGGLEWLSAIRHVEDLLEQKYGAEKFMDHAEKISKLKCILGLTLFFENNDMTLDFLSFVFGSAETKALLVMTNNRKRSKFLAQTLGEYDQERLDDVSEKKEMELDISTHDEKALVFSKRFLPTGLKENERNQNFMKKLDLVGMLLFQMMNLCSNEDLLKVLHEKEVIIHNNNLRIMKTHNKMGGKLRAYFLMVYIMENFLIMDGPLNIFESGTVEVETNNFAFQWFASFSKGAFDGDLEKRFADLNGQGFHCTNRKELHLLI